MRVNDDIPPIKIGGIASEGRQNIQNAKDQRNVDAKLSGVVVSKAENPSSMKISVPSLWKQGFWLCKQRPRIVIAV